MLQEVQEQIAKEQCKSDFSRAEAAIHSMKELFGMEENDAVILVDASNAFNCLSRKVALHNIQYICPPLAITLINTYRQAARLFISGGAELLSQEWTI